MLVPIAKWFSVDSENNDTEFDNELTDPRCGSLHSPSTVQSPGRSYGRAPDYYPHAELIATAVSCISICSFSIPEVFETASSVLLYM